MEEEVENDFIFTYILPIVSSIGFFLSLLCLIIFSNSIFKEKLYSYLKIETIFCATYLIIQSLRPIHSCAKCQVSSSIVSQIYYLYFAVYVVSICEFSAFAFQIFAAINCYRMIIRMKNETKVFFKIPLKMVCFLTVVFSCTLFSFQLIEYEIIAIKVEGNFTSSIKYITNCTQFWFSDFRKICEITAIIIRDIIGTICLLTINLILFINLNITIKRKRSLLSSNSIRQVQFDNFINVNPVQNQKSPKTTSQQNIDVATQIKTQSNHKILKNTKNCNIRMILMVTLTCLNCLLGRLPISVYFLLRNTNLFEEDDLVGRNFIQYCITFISLSFSLNFLLYYFSNRKFKRIFNNFLRFKKNKII